MDYSLLRHTDRVAVPRLVNDLFTLLLAQAPRAPDLSYASESTWRRALDVLEPHKVFALLNHRLDGFGCELPASQKERLASVHKRVRAINMLHILNAANALRAANAAGESLVLMKGLLFADGYYPDVATRPMGDVDLVCMPGHGEALCRVLEGAGFVRGESPKEHDHDDEDTLLYTGPQGVSCDLHVHMQMFDGLPFDTLTEPVALALVKGVAVRRFEPSAMVAHLTQHFYGHMGDIGPVLLWVLDFAFVLRKDGDRIDPEKVRAILRDDVVYGLFLRILGLLHQHGEALGPVLTEYARRAPPLLLGEVLRQRRLVPWRVPSARGFVRLLVHKLHLRVNEHRPEVATSDLWLWPMDLLAAELARRSAQIDATRERISRT